MNKREPGNVPYTGKLSGERKNSTELTVVRHGNSKILRQPRGLV